MNIVLVILANVIDLVFISEDEYINDISIKSSLGNSDHSVIE